MDCCIGDLQDKEVINVCDGRRLGFICDVEADVCSGKITAIIVPGCSRSLWQKKSDRIRIPWDRICRVGNDLILVQLSDRELPPPPPGKGKRSFWES